MTHAYVGLIAFDLVATAVGFALLRGLRISGPSLRFAGLAFLSGWAALGICLSLLAMVGLDPRLVVVLPVAAALVALFSWARRFAPPFAPLRAPATRSPLALAAAVASGAFVVLAVAVALLESVRTQADWTWDAWQFWLPKAQAIYFFHGLDTGLSGFTTYGNPEYPPLVPLMTAASFHFMGGVDPLVLPLQQCLLLVAFLASLAALLRRVPGWILYPSLWLIVAAPQVWGEMFSVLPDQTLAYLLAIAAVAGILWLEDPRPAWLALALLFLAAAALTKTEGQLLGFLLAAVLIGAGLAMRGRGAARAFVLLLGPLAVVPWKVWLSVHHQPLNPWVYSWSNVLHPGYLADRFGRMTYAMRYMLDLLLDPGRWSPMLPLALAALVVLAPQLRALSVALAAWVVIAFLGLATVYWIGTPDVVWYATSSASRVVTSLSLVAGALLPLLLGIALEREREGSDPP